MADRFSKWKLPVVRHGKFTKWHWVVFRPEKFKLGPRTDIGAFTAIFAHHGVEIGEEAQVGSHCSIYSVSTIDDTKGRVRIGKRARIGSHSTIMPGVTIGDDAIVGAHSFVKSDVPAKATAYGVPAKLVGKRRA
ncbi:acetyltransferase [Candidatus Kaiserbacteria bacterium RIFCSPHIGHO2_02_FULL_59_21]|uniref:Transferase hexapeptide repeat containing protein n=2 Tax=Candidatus Kaiseribacteriota TaxID=1752734 RepID=A0A0G2AZW3_9BACT|nr:MAG: Transferase hexapeptide repeat containing protein [Candidatus Kaiserbacteria bacterium GW2011_GWA2_58_9]OGG62763.1 MAG: acetyltransferase [Candidatus Kaiserbacteria bacterium RIFCSPHIGHO2_01_FULL_58_22]OGG67151.1 MAG: acetyltransferase [Candidatus Kaiserbacteria bacterium RIFCSPHIGHO2_02_FULL_59_21]OGG79040.1 MAG: acetyltransferase [Candidatus Kaiserbacteria bacterium RIFCSPLOWO2_01_FULL_59_34]OGG86384.1 MAG: acetyltransferase [Candidatus Kaiserbacteria bacterium RIFCSPLOWO2_02_FULL_59_